MNKYELNLYDYWRIIYKRKGIILISFLATIFFTFVYFETRPKEYLASSLIKVGQRFTMTELPIGTYVPASAETDPMMVTSYEVIKATVKKLGLVNEKSSELEIEEAIRYVQDSVKAEEDYDYEDYIVITAVSSDPKEAANIANAVAETFIVVDTQEQSKEARFVRQYIERQLKVTKQKLEEVERSLLDTTTKSELFADRDAIFKTLSDMQLKLVEIAEVFTVDHPKVIELRKQIRNRKRQLESISDADLLAKRLKRDIEVHRKLYVMLREELEKVSITEAGKVTTALIVDRAKVPTISTGPDKGTAVFTGAVFGLMMGLILVFTREQLDTSIATIDDVEEFIKLPVLGIIPHETLEETEGELTARDKLTGGGAASYREEAIIRMISLYKPKSPETESYRTLRTNIQFVLAKDKSKVLLFTSAGPQEGKSTVIINTAITMVQTGKKVLLIGANLRRPTIYKTFDIKKDPGLADILIERVRWEEAIKSLPDFLRSTRHRDIIEKSPELDNLKIITSGGTPPNPTELISSPEMDKLLSEVREQFDIILIDCPPTLPVADAGILGSKVDKVIIVYKVGKTARTALHRAKIRLESLGAKLCGIILNDITTEIDVGAATYYYHYKYYGEGKLPRIHIRRKIKNRLRKYNAILLTLKRNLKARFRR